MGRTEKDSRVVYILDFGLVGRYRLRDGTVRPARAAAGFRGTVRYASINAHKNVDLGRRDDMWLFSLVEMYVGQLPWRLFNNKTEVGTIKAETSRQKLMPNMDREFLHIYDHIVSLRYETTPDYKRCQQLLTAVLTNRKLDAKAPYDWEQGGLYSKQTANVPGQPFGKQMKALKKVVQEKVENEEAYSL